MRDVKILIKKVDNKQATGRILNKQEMTNWKIKKDKKLNENGRRRGY